MKKKQIQTSIKNGLHALVWQEGDWCVAKCLEVEVASQGKSGNESLKNLEEAIDLYFAEEKVTSVPEFFVKPKIYSYPFAYA